MVDEGGKTRPLTEWIVERLMARGMTDTGMSRVLALRSALQLMDQAHSGEITPEQLAGGLRIHNLALGQVASGTQGIETMHFGGPKSYVGREEIRACFARWNGGGCGLTLHYARDSYRVTQRMLDEDYPRNRHPLGATCDPAGRLITDVSAQWGSVESIVRQRRYHDSYWSARHDALQLRGLHPTAPIDIGTINPAASSEGVLQLTV